MRFLLALLLSVMVTPLTWADVPQVKVAFQWEYKDFAAPVALYEVRGQSRLWDTKSVESLKAAPLGRRIEGSEITLTPGQSKRFALVVQNETDKPMYFFAAPHVVHPVEHSLGFKFKCLCINHAYKVNPHETWYRVVEFRLAKAFVGEEFTVTHSVIGIDEKRAQSFEKEAMLPDL